MHGSGAVCRHYSCLDLFLLSPLHAESDISFATAIPYNCGSHLEYYGDDLVLDVAAACFISISFLKFVVCDGDWFVSCR